MSVMKYIVALAFVGLNFYLYEYFASEEVLPPRSEFAVFPLQIEGWSCDQPEEMNPAAMRFLGASDYLLCTYRREQPWAQVGVYVGYHATQVREKGGFGGENSIHPPEHCLPGAGWDIIDSRVVPLELPGLPEGHGLRARGPEAKRFVIAKGDARQLVYFWYQTQGRVIARNEDVILYRFWNRAKSNRTDGSLVRFTVEIARGDVATAEATLREFAEQFAPLLSDYIPL
jgi:EpsI family protein